uniref:Hemerythrin n=1 Tax=Aulodrilus japonicus TaxID=2020002 RepID=A0A286MJS0_9ANNE|nr:hemerythrin [Aulodrilus japonicus]
MSFPIPEPYRWDESFAVFYQTIDDEHKGLFDGIFKCANSPSDGAALTDLAQLVKHHFATEEAMFKKANYSEYEAHKKLHDEFVETLGTLSTPLSADTIKFAKEWLVNHIKCTDFKYKGKL